ncbi:MAG: PEP-CTERM sorting domain-containing protein [Janthinobacterium lividum]
MTTPFDMVARLARVTRKMAAVTIGAASVFAFAPAPAHATPVILNGSFETTTATASTEFGTRYGGANTVTNWTTGGYNFLFLPGTADMKGAAYSATAQLKLWGPNDGSANGLPASSPDGGNFIGADGAYEVGAIQQTITGLDMNSVASITFYWAGAQQYNFTGATTEAWQVTLGNETHSTGAVNNLTEGFTGWQKTTLSFVVTSTTEVLSFLAVGTPSGEPPFSLLDGVSISEIPEPASLTLLGVGFVLAGIVSCRRRAA